MFHSGLVSIRAHPRGLGHAHRGQGGGISTGKESGPESYLRKLAGQTEFATAGPHQVRYSAHRCYAGAVTKSSICLFDLPQEGHTFKCCRQMVTLCAYASCALVSLPSHRTITSGSPWHPYVVISRTESRRYAARAARHCCQWHQRSVVGGWCHTADLCSEPLSASRSVLSPPVRPSHTCTPWPPKPAFWALVVWSCVAN